MLSFAVLPEVSRAQESPPEWLTKCMQDAHKVFIAEQPTRAAVDRFVDQNAVLQDMRNQTSYSDPNGVIDSALNFAQYVHGRAQERADSDNTIRIHSIRNSHGRTHIRASIGQGHDSISVRLTLVANTCQGTNFIIEGVLGMRDRIPRT